MKAHRPRVSPLVLALCFAASAGCGGGGTPHLSQVDWDTPENWARNDHLTTVDYEAEPSKRFWRFDGGREFQGRRYKAASLCFEIRNTTAADGAEGIDAPDLRIVAEAIDDRGRIVSKGVAGRLRISAEFRAKYMASDEPLPIFPPGATAEAYFPLGEIPADSKRLLIRILSPAAGWRPVYWTQGVPSNRPAS